MKQDNVQGLEQAVRKQTTKYTSWKCKPWTLGAQARSQPLEGCMLVQSLTKKFIVS